MPFSLSGSNITQTGTDVNLSGLVGIAGVTVNTRDLHTTYTLETLQLTVTGTLSIDPATEQLVFGNTPSDDALILNSGATLNVGTEVVVNSESTFSEGLWLRVTRRGVVAWSVGGLRVNTGSTINWRGGDIDTAASPYFAGTCNIRRGSIYLRETLVQVARCLCSGAANLTNLTLYNNGFGPDAGFTGSFSNCKVVDGQVIGMHGSVVNLTITDYDYEARGNILTAAANSKWESINTVRGMQVACGHLIPTARLLYCKNLSFNVLNINGAPIPNVAIYSKEYIGINRPPLNFIPGDDFTTPLKSVVATNASGSASINKWRLGLHYRDASATKLSFWTKSGNNTDVQDFALWGYGVLPQIVDIPLKGAGTLLETTKLLPDTNVTLSEAAAVAKLATGFMVDLANNIINVAEISTLDDLYDAIKAWKTRPIAEQLEYPTISTQPVVASGDTLVTSMSIIGVEFLTAGTKFKKIQAAYHIANGSITNLSIVGNVWQDTPLNLTNVTITGTLIYYTASAATISLTNTQIGTVQNDDTGIITITRDATSSITDYSDPEVNFLDSSIVATNITSATIYQTAAHRDANTNAGATLISNLDFKYGALLNGVTMSNTVYLRVLVGNITLLAELPLVIGVNTLDLGVQGQLSAISSKIDTRPTLAQIEVSPVLAKEATVVTRATQTSVSAIPTTPLLTNDTRLANLDTTISSRLSASAYVAPSNPDLSTLATTAQLTAARDDINANIDSIQTVTPPTAEQIATAVEAALLNDLDGQALLDAIADQIGNQNIDQIALVAAIRTELERAGGTSQLIKEKVETLSNSDLSALATSSQLEAAKLELLAEVDAVPTAAEVTAAVWAATNRALTDKLDFALSASGLQAIAVAVEAALINDLDGQALLDAIAANIGNQNIDQIALVAAIRTELERTGGTSQRIKEKVETLSNSDLSALATSSQLEAAKLELLAEVDAVPTAAEVTAAVWVAEERTLNKALFK